MSRFLWPAILFVFLLDVFPGAAAQSAPSSPVDVVNERIGTAGEGQTFPATGVPFAMTQWTPQTRAGEGKCVAPYYAADTRIQGFRGSHFLSGSCMQDYGSFTVMPLASPEKLGAGEQSSAFARQSEQAHPYLYTVALSDSGIHAEITGSERAGMMRFRYAAGTRTGWLSVENNKRLGNGTIRIDPLRQEITGANPVYRIYAGEGQPAGFSGYVVIQFDRPFHPGGTWAGQTRREGALEESSETEQPGAYVAFDLPADETVTVRIGTSFTSIDEARRNLAAEMPDWDFNAAVQRARSAWEHALGAIQVAGSSPDRRIFYTALYHSMLLPRIFSDRSGVYPRFGGGGRVETANGFTYYCDFSAWDTFRAVHPLLAILDPDRERDMVKSLIVKGQEGGYLPIFPAWNSYTAEMIGDHAGVIIADAYTKGIRGFDAEAAYRLMRQNATQLPGVDAYRNGQGRRGLDSYLHYGYIPLEDRVPNAFHANEQVSRTLEYAYDDSVLSSMARALGHAADARIFARRAQNYRYVIDPVSGFARGRHADGAWDTPFDPARPSSYITESTPYVYTFFVPQDIPGLISTLHGRAAFEKKLDGLFAGGYYDHGNEPSHHIAYLYDDAGVPAKTQLHVHEVMSKLYRDSADGLAGNDDAGQMSAWYVLSALGFYPVTPGTPKYSIGTPRFDEMTVNLGHDRRLHIRASGAEAGNFYVRSVRLNGVVIHRPFILHSELVRGGELIFEMSAKPAE
jgi:predicted alpha-1,2-mannosidase